MCYDVIVLNFNLYLCRQVQAHRRKRRLWKQESLSAECRYDFRWLIIASAIQLFEGKKVRIVWDSEQEKYYFAIVDIVQVLTDSDNPQTYWRVLKKRLRDEGNETVTNCNALKMPAADGKNRKTDVADLEQVFRIIQSIPSKKA